MKWVVAFALVSTCSCLRVFDSPGDTFPKEFDTESGPVTLIVGKKSGRALKLGVPEPFEVTSPLMQVKDDTKKSPSNRRSRQMQYVTIDDEGVPVIDGVREPDDPNDKRVFRNARVINNVLVTDEMDAQNQIDEAQIDAHKQKPLHREGRILTGPVEPSYQEQITASTNSFQYPAYYYNQNYSPARTGPVDEQRSKEQPEEESIVTYSYSTSEGDPPKKTSKDVVYGSGFAAQPFADSSKKGANETPRYLLPNSQISNEAFKPSSYWAGFSPSDSVISSRPQVYDRKSTSQSSGSTFKFPSSSSSVSLPLSSSSFQSSTSTSGVQPINNNIGSSQFGQDETNFPSWSTLNQRYQTNDPVQNVAYRFPGSSPQYNSQFVNNNQIRRTQHHGGAPTPHQAFGEASSMIHPGIVPANSKDFIIEKATFQTHPGAPVFSVPVPRPAPAAAQHRQQHQQQQQHQQHQQQHQLQQHQFQLQHQQHQQQQQQRQQQQQQHQQQQQDLQNYYHPNQYPGNPYYSFEDYYEELDNRPLIDKMMDPLRRVGERVREIASPVIDPVIDAGHRFGNRLRIPERVDKIANGNVDADAIPLVGGAVAVATLGALGAYAATKYSFNDIKRLLPTTRTVGGSHAKIPDVLLKLASDLEAEDPAFLGRFTSSTAWLESSCAQRIFCTLVTTSLKEEEQKREIETMKKEFEARLENSIIQANLAKGEENVEKTEKADGDVKTEKEETPKEEPFDSEGESRASKRFFEREISYIEKQINSLVDGIRDAPPLNRSKSLRTSAKNVVDAVKNRNCHVFSCDKHI